MKAYNSAHHRMIEMTPSEAVKPENELRIRVTNEKRFMKLKTRVKNQKKIKRFKVGDHVRVLLDRLYFRKRSYKQTHSEEVFEVARIKNNLVVPLYELQDFNKKRLEGFFYANELALVSPDAYYPIKRVIKRGKNRVLVSFKGYPDDWHEWVERKNVKEF